MACNNTSASTTVQQFCDPDGRIVCDTDGSSMSMFIVTIIRSGQQTPMSILHIEHKSQAEGTVKLIENLLHKKGGTATFRFLSGNDLTKVDTNNQIKSAIRKTLECFPNRQTI